MQADELVKYYSNVLEINRPFSLKCQAFKSYLNYYRNIININKDIFILASPIPNNPSHN